MTRVSCKPVTGQVILVRQSADSRTGRQTNESITLVDPNSSFGKKVFSASRTLKRTQIPLRSEAARRHERVSLEPWCPAFAQHGGVRSAVGINGEGEPRVLLLDGANGMTHWGVTLRSVEIA